MRFSRSCLLASLLFLSLSDFAQGAALAVVGAMKYGDAHYNGGTYHGAANYGGGLLADFRFWPFMSFELGALYLPTRFGYFDAPNNAQADGVVNSLEFPLVIHYHPSRHFSVGAGGYYATRLGGYSYSENSVGKSLGLGSVMTRSDYGWVGSMNLYITLKPLTNILIEARYTSSLRNNAVTAGGSLRFTAFQTLVGFRFGF